MKKAETEKRELFNERSEQTLEKAFRLYIRSRKQHTYYSKYTAFTITPKGKNRSHKYILDPFIATCHTYKSIYDVFLVPESENTNHFHGILVTKSKCKFAKFFNKKQPYTFYITPLVPIGTWCNYMTKSNPTSLYTLSKPELDFFDPATPSLHNKFNKTFQLDLDI